MRGIAVVLALLAALGGAAAAPRMTATKDCCAGAEPHDDDVARVECACCCLGLPDRAPPRRLDPGALQPTPPSPAPILAVVALSPPPLPRLPAAAPTPLSRPPPTLFHARTALRV